MNEDQLEKQKDNPNVRRKIEITSSHRIKYLLRCNMSRLTSYSSWCLRGRPAEVNSSKILGSVVTPSALCGRTALACLSSIHSFSIPSHAFSQSFKYFKSGVTSFSRTTWYAISGSASSNYRFNDDLEQNRERYQIIRNSLSLITKAVPRKIADGNPSITPEAPSLFDKYMLLPVFTSGEILHYWLLLTRPSLMF